MKCLNRHFHCLWKTFFCFWILPVKVIPTSVVCPILIKYHIFYMSVWWIFWFNVRSFCTVDCNFELNSCHLPLFSYHSLSPCFYFLVVNNIHNMLLSHWFWSYNWFIIQQLHFQCTSQNSAFLCWLMWFYYLHFY